MPARLIVGQRGAGEYGFWVSKSGIDVFTASGDNLLFDASTFHARPVMVGSVVTNGVTVYHGLGYVPLTVFSGDFLNNNGTAATVDATNLYVTGTATKPLSYVVYPIAVS
jgi:hypothetical protein